MSIELNEQEALLAVTALGTKYHRLGQRIKWLKDKRIVTLNKRLVETPEDRDDIDKAIERCNRHISLMEKNCDELESLCSKIRKMYNIPYKNGDSPENK